jgi:hypothetical protein
MQVQLNHNALSDNSFVTDNQVLPDGKGNSVYHLFNGSDDDSAALRGNAAPFSQTAAQH